MSNATDLLWHLFDGLTGYLCVTTAKRLSTKDRLFNFTDNYLYFPDEIAAVDTIIEDANKAGLETFFVASLLTEKSRAKEYSAGIQTLFVDGDGAGETIPDHLPQPTASVESSPGKRHWYYKLDRLLAPPEAETLNKRLASAIGADKSGIDATQLLRLPGTRNHKYVGFPLVELLELEDAYYKVEDLAECLPELPTVNQLFDSSDNEPPVYLTGAGLEYWQGKRQKLKPDGETDKSETLIAIAYHLRNAGASVKVIAEALSNRDSALAYNKYSGRKDASRYYLDIAKHASTSIAIPDTFDRQLTSEDSQPAAVISYRRLDITELLDEETSQVNPLVYGLIYPGMLSIIGSWVGTGKTSLVMALVAALVNQENALDCLPTTSIKGNIVYFSELPKKSMSKTLRSMSLTYEVDPVKLSEKLHVYDITGDSVLIPSVAAQVKSICKNATLVVIDTFDAWFNGNPNDTAQVLEAWTLLKNIASDNSAAILVLDHQSKSKPDQKTQETAVSGSAAKQRYADLVYRLDRSDGANILTPVKDRFGVAVNLQIRKNDENKLVAFK